MSTLLPYLISWVQSYGYPVIWLCACLSAAGLPLPTVLVLLAAGAFAALGDFNIALLFLVALTAAVAGDNIGYLLGKSFGGRLLAWLERPRSFQLLSPKALDKGHDYFRRRGIWAIFLSRFLFAALGGIINIVAGTERYSYPRFLLSDVGGEILGVLIPLVLGYTFGASWENIGDILSGVSIFAFALLVGSGLLFYLIRAIRKAQATAVKEEKKTVTPTIGSTNSFLSSPLVPRTTFHKDEQSTDSLPL